MEALAFREWTCPNLKRLWLGKAVEDKNRRMRAFLACMRSDTPAMLNPANVPTHLMVLCCVLRCVTGAGHSHHGQCFLEKTTSLLYKVVLSIEICLRPVFVCVV